MASDDELRIPSSLTDEAARHSNADRLSTDGMLTGHGSYHHPAVASTLKVSQLPLGGRPVRRELFHHAVPTHGVPGLPQEHAGAQPGVRADAVRSGVRLGAVGADARADELARRCVDSGQCGVGVSAKGRGMAGRQEGGG